MTLLPMFLRVERRPCLVVGGGTVAMAKIESLRGAGAAITVVAPEAHPDVDALAERGAVTLHRREFVPGDLDSVFLVIAATNATKVNRRVFEEARRRNVLCNAVDDPPNCDFYFGSVVARGDLQIAISTAGESPALALQLRQDIDQQLPGDLGPWLRELGELRREVRAGTPAGEDRNLLLHELAQRQVCGLAECPARRYAGERIEEIRGGARRDAKG
jgi:precorrin-2 dehydrogenase / sirohydrochlorin ferrochelatase